jgi:hypothetical protein
MAAITIVIPAAPGIRLEALDSAAQQRPAVETIVETGRNPSTNRNRGAARATTPLVAFVNAHTVLQQDWAAQVESFFAAHPEISIAGGPQLTSKDEPYFARLSGDALTSPFCTGKMSQRYQPGALNLDADETSLTSANLICRREVFAKVQFDETLYPGEDPKFITDARAAGFKVACVPDIVVYNRRRTTLDALWKQISSYGATRVQKETLGELLRQPAFFVPALLVVYLFVLPFLLAWSHWCVLPLAAYLLLAVFFGVAKAVECGRVEYPLTLPPVFLWIHLAYGAGFLVRFLRGGWAKKA